MIQNLLGNVFDDGSDPSVLSLCSIMLFEVQLWTVPLFLFCFPTHSRCEFLFFDFNPRLEMLSSIHVIMHSIVQALPW